MNDQELLNIISKQIDQKYQLFSSKLANSKEIILGIRVPILKKLVKKYQNEDLSNITKNVYLEVDQFLVFFSKYKFTDYKERLEYLESIFINCDSWAITDSATFCFEKKNKEIAWFFIKKRNKSKSTFLKRASYILFLKAFIDDKSKLNYLLIHSKTSNQYYINMVIAWTLATSAIYFYNDIYKYLEKLDKNNFIKKMTIRKMKDSYRISEENKLKLNYLIK